MVCCGCPGVAGNGDQTEKGYINKSNTDIQRDHKSIEYHDEPPDNQETHANGNGASDQNLNNNNDTNRFDIVSCQDHNDNLSDNNNLVNNNTDTAAKSEAANNAPIVSMDNIKISVQVPSDDSMKNDAQSPKASASPGPLSYISAMSESAVIENDSNVDLKSPKAAIPLTKTISTDSRTPTSNFTMDAYLQRVFQLRKQIGAIQPNDLMPSTSKFQNNFVQFGQAAADAVAGSIRESQQNKKSENFDTGPDGGHSLFTDIDRRILPTLSQEFNVSKRALHQMNRQVDTWSILKDHSKFNKEEMEARHYFPLEGGFSSQGIDSKTGRPKIDDNLRFVIQLYHGFQFWLIDKDVVKIDRGHLLHPQVADIVKDLVVGTFDKQAFVAPAQKQGMVSDMEDYNNRESGVGRGFGFSVSSIGDKKNKGARGSGGCGPGGAGLFNFTPKTDVLFFSGKFRHPTNDLWPGFIIQKKMDGVSSDLALKVLKDPKYYPIFDTKVGSVALFETNDEYSLKVGIYPGVPFVVAARGMLVFSRHYQYSHNKKVHIIFTRSVDPTTYLEESNEDYKKLIMKKGTVLGSALSAWIIEQNPSEIEISTRVTFVSWSCPMGNVENSSMVAKAFGKLGFSEMAAVVKKVHKVCLDVKAGKV